MLSMSERGKLGAIKARPLIQKAKEKRMADYYANPKLCIQCEEIIEYDKRDNKFCNHSCAASFNNPRKVKKVYDDCAYCGKELTPRNNKYCNRTCQHDKQYHDMIRDYQTGVRDKIEGKTVKRFLAERDGYQCNVCGIVDWCDKPIVLQLEHIDGNADNNKEENLCLLCANCHSQTPTFAGRNRGNGRHYRRVRYAEGKST